MTSSRWSALSGVLVLIALVRIVSTFGIYSATADEATHTGAGLELLQNQAEIAGRVDAQAAEIGQHDARQRRDPLVDAYLLQRIAPVLVTRRKRGKQILADSPRPPLPPEVRNRRKTGFTVPIKEWLRQEGVVEFGKRAWAKKVFQMMFSEANGSW